MFLLHIPPHLVILGSTYSHKWKHQCGQLSFPFFKFLKRDLARKWGWEIVEKWIDETRMFQLTPNWDIRHLEVNRWGDHFQCNWIKYHAFISAANRASMIMKRKYYSFYSIHSLHFYWNNPVSCYIFIYEYIKVNKFVYFKTQ